MRPDVVRETSASMVGMPAWWGERRLGLFVHATVASVPAWAPIGQYAEWYRSHLGEDVPDVVLHPGPLPEVLAHHRDRWGHIERYDDFVELLTFDRFDADEWARFAREAGAGYSILVTKHHDGWAWWDAPNSTRRLTDAGPCRNVVAEYAAACERHDVTFGTYYSLLDWGDHRYPGRAYVDEVLHPQVLDLVERYGSAVLWGDGHWGHDAGVWRTRQLLDRVREIDPDVVVNDRWWASSADLPAGAPPLLRTFEYDAPDDITPGPWELCRGVAHSFGHNRAERAEHHLTGLEIVELLTEVVAKGGNLLLNVGPSADGTIPALQADPIRDAGTWVRRHAHLLAGARPWERWGGEGVRYLRSGSDLLVVDVQGRGRFDDLATGCGSRVLEVELAVEPERHAVTWVQHADGLHAVSVPVAEDFHADRIGVAVYRLRLAEEAETITLFETIPDRPTALAPLLDGARAGDIVQLGEGRYVGPAHVPDGVILRGLGADRTQIVDPTAVGPAAAGIRPAPPTLTLGRNARAEHLRISGRHTRSDWFPPPVCRLDGRFGTLLGCTVDGVVEVVADDAIVRAVKARGVVGRDADRLMVARCRLTGNRWDVGIDLAGGGGHEIDSCELGDHLCAIHLAATTGTTVRGNVVSGRWWGVRLTGAEDARVKGNRFVGSMRAVDVDGGTDVVVAGNAVRDGDSGCLVQRGAAQVHVSGNHWERCRVGLIDWGAVDLRRHDNRCSDLHEEGAELVRGP